MMTNKSQEIPTISQTTSTAAWGSFAVFTILIFSGFAGLVYEVMWLRTIKNVFGSTAHATSSVLAVFFAGLSLGNAYWGARCQKIKNPLRTLSYIEFGIALSALLYFILLPFYRSSLTSLFIWTGQNQQVFFVLKMVLVAGIVFLPSFFMGGTLPVATEFFLRRHKSLGTQGSLLYGMNTIAAALGAFFAGFFLPIYFGYQNTYVFAIVISVAMGILAWLASFNSIPTALPVHAAPEPGEARRQEKWIDHIEKIAFLSGFLTLVLEVLWTHLFAQVLQNSVYTFSVILVTFVLALGLGALIAHLLCRLKSDPEKILWPLLFLSGCLVVASAWVFYKLTGNLAYFGASGGWGSYILTIFTISSLSFGGPVLIIGALFPYLLKVSEKYFVASPSGTPPPNLMGRLLAINTLGSILGSLVAGFFLIQTFGVWQSVLAAGLIYLIAAWIWVPANRKTKIFCRVLTLAAAILCMTIANPSFLPIVQLEVDKKESLVEVWEGPYGVISVVDYEGSRQLMANNHFGLGGYWRRATKVKMADLAMMLHPKPETIFFEGMGTGISAGRVLDYSSVQKIRVAEIVPEVVEAAEKYFSQFHSLFEDPRAEIMIEDARNYLAYSSEKYDLVISDLFFPWQEGAGSLYSFEHFKNVSHHLKPGGVFVQWLAAYQLTEKEFKIIAKTMLATFPQVTLWRNNFDSKFPLLALVGENEKNALDPEMLLRNFSQYRTRTEIPDSVAAGFPLLLYAGNLTEARALFKDAPINRDDRPYVEYFSPISYIQAKADQQHWFSMQTLADFYERIFEAAPLETDPYLKEWELKLINFSYAGRAYYQMRVDQASEKLSSEDQICKYLNKLQCKELLETLKSEESWVIPKSKNG